MSRKEEILGYCGECNYKPFSTEACTAIKAIEWADKNPRKGLWDAEKVCKYLENHAGHYMTLENDEEGELQSVFYQKGLIEDLRKAMEEQQ